MNVQYWIGGASGQRRRAEGGRKWTACASVARGLARTAAVHALQLTDRGGLCLLGARLRAVVGAAASARDGCGRGARLPDHAGQRAPRRGRDPPASPQRVALSLPRGDRHRHAVDAGARSAGAAPAHPGRAHAGRGAGAAGADGRGRDRPALAPAVRHRHAPARRRAPARQGRRFRAPGHHRARRQGRQGSRCHAAARARGAAARAICAGLPRLAGRPRPGPQRCLPAARAGRQIQARRRELDVVLGLSRGVDQQRSAQRRHALPPSARKALAA
jgi:hypothetical protein